jgi:hypothetical protein
MTRRFSLFILNGIVLTAPVLLMAQNSGQTPSPAVMQAVEAAFPQELRYSQPQLPGAESSPDYYNTCAAVFHQNANNVPNLIAAAYNGDGAEIVMLTYSQGNANVLSAITNQQFYLGNGECNLQIVSLADPEHPDSSLAKTIDATFHDGPDWFFTWDGEKLQNITSLEADKGAWRGKLLPASGMYSARVIDIDHKGPMQIVGDNGGKDKFPQVDGIASTGTDTIFRYNGTTYVPTQTILSIAEFEPNLPKTPEQQAKYEWGTFPWTYRIAMHQTPAPSYQLKIVNGDRDGSNRVTSAKVEINGATIVLPAEVNQGVETLTRTIQLQKENKIKVTVDGPAKSHIYVIVE